MVPTVQAFDEMTAIKRRMLEWASPQLPSASERSRLDLRATPGRMVLALPGIVRDSGRQDALRELRPLLFGTAWKVLDLMLELAMHRTATPKQTRWTFVKKVINATALKGALKPLTTTPELWRRLCGIYVETIEARHALVHRRLECDPTGNIVNVGPNQSIITVAQQDALQGLALYSAKVILSGEIRPRDELIFGWYLNALKGLHGLPALAFAAKECPVVVQITAEPTQSMWEFDAGAAFKEAIARLPGRSYFDLEVYLADSRLRPVFGQLELAAPLGVVRFDPGVRENWMTP